MPGGQSQSPGARSWGEGRGQPGPAPSPSVCPATSEESLAELARCPEDGQGPAGLVVGSVLLGVRGPQWLTGSGGPLCGEPREYHWCPGTLGDPSV